MNYFNFFVELRSRNAQTTVRFQKALTNVYFRLFNETEDEWMQNPGNKAPMGERALDGRPRKILINPGREVGTR